MTEISDAMEWVKEANDNDIHWLIKWTTDLLAERLRYAREVIRLTGEGEDLRLESE